MKGINAIEPKKAIIFEDDKYGKMTLIECQSMVDIVTDGTDFPLKVNGMVVFLNESGIIIEDSDLIPWWHILEIKVK
jgi:hypothetical protein